MKIIYIQSYPVYHDFINDLEWLALENRDKWMPALTAEMGHDVELWAVANHDRIAHYAWKDITITIRLFKADYTPKMSKYHYSHSMVRYALEHPADYYIIKGIDGGAGIRMIKEVLKKVRKPFAFVVGGKCTSPYLHLAHAVFYESDVQILQIRAPYLTITGRKQCRAHLIKLPKSIDTSQFVPMPEIEKAFDLVSTGRLISYYKKFDSHFSLSDRLKVSFIGSGPLLQDSRLKWPNVQWYGSVSHSEIPRYLNTARAFFYPSKRDYFPRAIVEAAACGLPVFCFEDNVSDDVVPNQIGFRLKENNYVDQMIPVLKDTERLAHMGTAARQHALVHFGKESSKQAIEVLFNLLK